MIINWESASRTYRVMTGKELSPQTKAVFDRLNDGERNKDRVLELAERDEWVDDAAWFAVECNSKEE